MLSSLIEQAKVSERAGQWDEALGYYEQALSRLAVEGNAAQAAELLRWIGAVHVQRRAVDLSLEIFEASLMIAELNAMPAEIAKVLNCMGVVEYLRGDLSAAQGLYARARQYAEELDDQQLAATLDLNLGALANVRGDVAVALQSYGSALDRYRILGEDLNAARALNNLGMAHVGLNQFSAAESHFRDAAALAGEIGDMFMLGTVELNQAEMFLKAQNFEMARECCARALDIFNPMRAKTAIGEVYRVLGILYRQTGRPEQASTHLAMALGLAEVGQDRLLQAETQIEWAILHLEEGREREGITYLNRALRLFGEMQAQREVLDIQRRLEKMEGLYLPAVKEWSARMCDKDPHQEGYLERVAEYSYRLGAASGLSGWDLTVLRVGGLLHDVGKMVLPREAQREFTSPRLEGKTLSKVHTIAGDAITRELDFPREVQLIVRHHHEHFAGTGFPDRLRGEWIPMGARIVAVANRYDALTRPRGERAPLSPSEALSMMEQDAGRIYDPELLACFRGVLGAAVTEVIAA